MDIDTDMYVTFKLGNEQCAFSIDNVISIERIQSKTRVPNAPGFVEGVINLRGDVIAVINLRKKLNMPTIDLGKDSRIIIVNYEDIIAGIVVDSSSEVMKIDRDSIDSPSVIEDSANHRYIKGIGKTENGIVTILKIEEIFKS